MDLTDKDLEFVRRIAGIMRQRVPVDIDELIADGNVGLVMAAKSYKPECGAWKSWAGRRIKGEMLDGIRRRDHLSRDHRASGETVDHVFLDHPSHSEHADQNDGCMSEVIASTEPTPEQLAFSADLWRLVRSTVNARERELLHELYVENTPGIELAKRFGVNQSRISQLHRKALDSVRRAMYAVAR